jgi:hypothetical protein
MARPIQQVIDGEFRELDAATPLNTIVPPHAQSIVSADGKLIPRHEFDKLRAQDVPGGFDTNLAQIVQAAPEGPRVYTPAHAAAAARAHAAATQARAQAAQRVRVPSGPARAAQPGDIAGLMAHEVAMLQGWLNRFPSPGRPRIAGYEPKAKLLTVANFPLPDHCQPDYIDLLINVRNYPSVAPTGIYLRDAPGYTAMLDSIANKIHAMRTGFHGAEQPIPGYRWVCLISESWPVNYQNLHRGQTLQKFLATFYALA